MEFRLGAADIGSEKGRHVCRAIPGVRPKYQASSKKPEQKGKRAVLSPAKERRDIAIFSRIEGHPHPPKRGQQRELQVSVEKEAGCQRGCPIKSRRPEMKKSEREHGDVRTLRYLKY